MSDKSSSSNNTFDHPNQPRGGLPYPTRTDSPSWNSAASSIVKLTIITPASSSPQAKSTSSPKHSAKYRKPSKDVTSSASTANTSSTQITFASTSAAKATTSS